MTTPPKAAAQMIGRHFGVLTVIGFSHRTSTGASVWNCRCACGTQMTAATTDLTGWVVRSCGCRHERYREYPGRVLTAGRKPTR